MVTKLTAGVHQRLVRSFVRREGRMTAAQQTALLIYLPQYGLSLTDGFISSEKIFNRVAPLIIEIGFGMGDSLLTLALAQPEFNYIGIEVYRPGVGSLSAAIAAQQVRNIRIFNDDAVAVLTECIVDASVTAIYIFFPDPWPKLRHYKRRLIQPAFIELIKSKLLPGGTLHLATDWQAYANQMLSVLTNALGWENLAGIGQFYPRPAYRPLTKFEQRGHRLGHKTWDLLFQKNDG